MTRTRTYSITLNNPTKTKEELLKELEKQYKLDIVVIGEEIGEKEKTRHYQIYIRFINAISFDSIQSFFEKKAHIENSKGNDKENIEYCIKDNNYILYNEEKINNILQQVEKEEETDNLINDILLYTYNYNELVNKYRKYTFYHYRDFRQLFYDVTNKEPYEYNKIVEQKKNGRDIIENALKIGFKAEELKIESKEE